MSAVFLAFANSSENRLPTLSMEDDQVYATLAQRQVQQHFTVHRDSFSTLRKITDYLILYRDFLSVFLFSGHAGRDALFLEAETANAEGVAHLLGLCPNLKLIILNGCSTAAQVQRLIELPNHPIVVATSAEVNDFAATQFSIAFFQTLSAQFDTIEKAFEAGLGATKMSASKEIRAGRKEINAEKSDEPLWGLYYAPAGEHNLQWKLPSVFNRLSDNYKSNELLIHTLIDALDSEDVKKIRTKEANNEDIDDLDKRDAILQSLPNPVSEQLSNLFAPRQGGSDAKFYNEPGFDRLEQLTATYGTIIELISFVMFSQLWDALQDNKDLNIEEDQRKLLSYFFQLRYDERLTYNFFH